MISLISKRRMEYQLKAAEERMVIVKEMMQQAAQLQDYSENAEYEAAVSEFTQLTSDIFRLKELLTNEPVSTEYSNVIAVGTLISVSVEENGQFSEPELMMFDEVGSGAFDGSISRHSPLGHVIEGRVGGTYAYQDSRGEERRAIVTIEPESRMDEYLEMYPPNRNIMLDRIFGE